MRIKFLASAVPLLIAGIVAGGEFSTNVRPCIALGGTSLQIATAPWQQQFHVSFTNDRAASTVRVQIVGRPELADFTVIDDIDTTEAQSCNGGDGIRYVSVAPHASAEEPVIYLSQDGGADFRIFVQSRAFSIHDAAALIVGSRRAPASQRTAAL
ncbi:MAG: hypothetical protein HY242_13240 [Afipia sp.]|nr:hypothetical protein [Afipia sp.]